ncbi:MAG: NAD-glutamate dehydrogenase, partial [Gammaproteobacteria bacterium]
MNRRGQPEMEKIVTKVTEIARQRVAEEQLELVEHFIRHYYRDVALEDLRRRDVGDLYGAALAHWNFLFRRKDGGRKLHIYNPQLEQHGWNSSHSVIDLVVTDMPFLVDSMRLALTRLGVNIHLIVHPVIGLRRDATGQVVEVLDARGAADDECREAVMHFEVDRQANEAELDRIKVELEATLADVEAAVTDWGAMRAKLRDALSQLEATPPTIPAGEFEEARLFLQWVEDHHFTLLGYRRYGLARGDGEDVLHRVGGSGLGVLRDDGQDRVSEIWANLPPEIKRLAREPCPLVITKGNTLSRVHRPGYMDYIGVKCFDGQGEVVGEHRFLGHYASAAFNRSPRFIPMLRQKLSNVVAAAGYRERSHDGKALLHILETFPRDLLFEVSDQALFETATGILHLQERQQVRLFVHRDTYGRYFSCLVYIPRERFNTVVRRAINDILEDAFGGESSDFSVQLSESVLARVIFTIRVPAGSQPDYQVEAIERQLDEVTRTWRDDLQGALLEQHGEEQGLRLFRSYGPAFRAGYRENYPAGLAVHDVEKMEAVEESTDALEMLLFRPLEATDGLMRFKLFRRREPIPLSDVLPMLENMGLKVVDERPSKLKPVEQPRIWLHDFGLQHTEKNLDLDRIRDLFIDAFDRIWHGQVENDGFNRLVLRARLKWREIVILRAYCKYLRQARFTFSQEYMEQALVDNPAITKMLVSLFHQRFDPAGEKDDTATVEETVVSIEQALDAVPNLDEDRILRGFLGLIQATLRTNYYQCGPEGAQKSYVAFK